jgi:hypothetical protein
MQELLTIGFCSAGVFVCAVLFRWANKMTTWGELSLALDTLAVSCSTWSVVQVCKDNTSAAVVVFFLAVTLHFYGHRLGKKR